jgi:hypothetical protein
MSLPCALALPLVFLAPMTPSQVAAVPGPILIPFELIQEPVLVYDVTGSTLIGPVHESLVVYNNGHVSWSAASFFTGGDGESCTFQVPIDVVRKLARALADAGAFELPDDPSLVTDVPLLTVTVMKAATDAKAHTFSFFGGFGDPHANVAMIINDFISEYVPGCGSLTQDS